MHLTGPSRVSDNGSITVTAASFGDAYSIKFDVAGISGNVGFDIKETRGATSLSYSAGMSFPGAERIDAIAQDEFGTAIARASHSFTVAATSGARAGDDGPGAGGGYIIDVEAPRQTEAGREWRYRMRGLRDLHSVVIELYGANGGIFRLFPRGRDQMEHAFIPEAPGETMVMISGRNAVLKTLVTVAGELQVIAPGSMAGQGAGGGYLASTHFAPIPPMGPLKPPKVVSPREALAATRSGPGKPPAAAMNGLDAVLEAKKAELLARLGRK
ncbi:MAG: hypothetical protein QM773_21625 [Hyphomonadaceae bacterium]